MKRRHNLSINQLLIIYLLLAMIPFSIAIIFFSNRFISIISQKSIDVIDYQAQHSTDILNNDMDFLLSVIYNIATDRELLSYCEQFANSNNTYYISSLLNNKFSFYQDLDTNICQCIFIDQNNRFSVSQRYPDNTDIEWQNEDYRNQIMKDIILEDRLVIWPAKDINLSRQINTFFYIGLPVKNQIIQETYGVLIIGIRDKFFDNIYAQNSDSNKKLPEILMSGHNLIVDEQEQIIYSNDITFIGKNLNDFVKKYNLKTSDYFLTKYDILHTDWIFYSYSPKIIVFDSVRQMQKLLVLFFVLFIALIIYLVTIVISHQNKKIRIIADGIQQFSGKEKRYHIQPANKDLNAIVIQFNKMTARISDLFQSLKEEQKRTEDALNRQRQAELRILEAQINPHFLYNTLDTINWMAIAKDDHEISAMLGSLASLLRYSISNIDSPVLIEAEIEWLNKYFFLQEKRFHGLFTYAIYAESGIENYPIYKMLIQPIVENCVLHAFCRQNSGGHITISFSMQNHRIYISIVDNGNGISQDKMKQLYELQKNYSEYTDDNIGIYNVLNRLDAYYGKDAHLKINSSSSGTTVIIDIPSVLATSNYVSNLDNPS